MFYFTTFYGDKNSLLYYFYMSAYKVFLGDIDKLVVTDAMPLNIIQKKKISNYIHDFIAPFYNYIRVNYSIMSTNNSNDLLSTDLKLESKIDVSVFGKTKNESISVITLKENEIIEFTYNNDKTKIKATCINS